MKKGESKRLVLFKIRNGRDPIVEAHKHVGRVGRDNDGEKVGQKTVGGGDAERSSADFVRRGRREGVVVDDNKWNADRR